MVTSLVEATTCLAFIDFDSELVLVRQPHVVVSLADEPVLAGASDHRLVVVAVTEVTLVVLGDVAVYMDVVQERQGTPSARTVEPVDIVEHGP